MSHNALSEDAVAALIAAVNREDAAGTCYLLVAGNQCANLPAARRRLLDASKSGVILGFHEEY